jgi:hypothetical protein
MGEGQGEGKTWQTESPDGCPLFLTFSCQGRRDPYARWHNECRTLLGESGFRQYSQPDTIEQRQQYARELAEMRHLTATVVVDTIDDTTSQQFGSLPNMVYVIDRDGTIAYKATWMMAEKIDQVLGALISADTTPAHVSA